MVYLEDWWTRRAPLIQNILPCHWPLEKFPLMMKWDKSVHPTHNSWISSKPKGSWKQKKMYTGNLYIPMFTCWLFFPNKTTNHVNSLMHWPVSHSLLSLLFMNPITGVCLQNLRPPGNESGWKVDGVSLG